MNLPNQGRQLFLYDHGRPHWQAAQGGPLFYDRRVPPPPPQQMANFPNAQLQAPSPQWLRGPYIGDPRPGHNQQHFDGFGVIPWAQQANHNQHRHNRHHHNRNGGAHRNNRLALHGRAHNRQNNDEMRYICFKCGDFLQNSAESGIHLCDAGQAGPEERQAAPLHNAQGGELQQPQIDHLHSRLKHFMEEAKVAVSSDTKLTQEEINKVCLERAEKFLTLYNQLHNEQMCLAEQQEKLEAQREELEKRDRELATLQTQLDQDRDKQAKDCRDEREEIARKWQELKDEIARMEEMHTVQKGRVRLDVGGCVFTTSRLTLTKDADSMLAAMFSGRHNISLEPDGSVFIDRDGTHFRYILNYLRDGGVNQDSLPKDRQVLRELRNEAVYFQLNGLVQTIEKFL